MTLLKVGKDNHMYAVYDKKKLIAYHDEKRVVKRYCNSINTNKREKDLYFLKIPKTIWKEKNHNPDLYLVRYGKSYIQSGYIDYVQTDYNINLSELYLSKDILLKIAETRNVPKAILKSFTKVLNFLEGIIKEEEEYVPTLEELQSIKNHMDEFRYHISDLEIDDYGWNH